MSENNFLIEKRLRELQPELHQRFRDAIYALLNPLSGYKLHFPEYTDHSELHTLTVIDYCNQLIGENVQHLNADELYVILMSCYMHDIGMGIRKEEYESFCDEIDFGDYFDTHDKEDTSQVLRDFHQEFTGCFIRKYEALFDFPMAEHAFAIIQTCRGHRKTDLFNEDEYPQSFALSNGNTICLPYLAAILRLADELDVTDERNLKILHNISQMEEQKQIFEHKKHAAITSLDIDRDAFVLHLDTKDRDVYDGVMELAGKMQSTLDYCVEVISKRTPYEITQRRIVIQEHNL